MAATDVVALALAGEDMAVAEGELAANWPVAGDVMSMVFMAAKR